jgi:hypothetical protein
MTLDEVRQLLSNAGLEYMIKERNGSILKINILIKEDK